jgi:hypothetical protein
VWHWVHGAFVGMWLLGFDPFVTFPANVGVVVWQPLQSPLVG